MRAMAALVAAFLAGCEPPLEPIAEAEQRILVHAVMDLGSNDQVILIERSPFNRFSGRGVRGATVTLETPFTTIQAFEIGQGDTLSDLDFEPTAYRFQNARAVPGFTGGSTLRLRVITATNDTITGTTTIPSAAPAGAPGFVPGFARGDTLRLSWPRVAGARGYEVGIYATLALDGQTDEAIMSAYRVFTDTSVAIAGTAWSIETGDDAFPLGRRVTVVVTAVDENYHLYYRPKVDPLAGAPPSRLTGGAVGVFGSIVPILVRRYDVR
jgi:hypothetical protein